MDTEQYEDAVRDYEKVYQTEKTKGKHVCVLCTFPLSKADVFVAEYGYHS